MVCLEKFHHKIFKASILHDSRGMNHRMMGAVKAFKQRISNFATCNYSMKSLRVPAGFPHVNLVKKYLPLSPCFKVPCPIRTSNCILSLSYCFDDQEVLNE
mmetsp:Transcript_6190/g.9027  ORF Transcript_6190/g.9027 Transcript_6190/m.9027 type:complete len:101 (+) Transcript_6190:449-751(+)